MMDMFVICKLGILISIFMDKINIFSILQYHQWLAHTLWMFKDTYMDFHSANKWLSLRSWMHNISAVLFLWGAPHKTYLKG